MVAPVDVRDFLTLVTKSGLLELSTAEAVAKRHQLADQLPAIEAAKAFIAEKHLTVFQAKQLLKGMWRGLCIDGYRLLYPLGAGGMGYVYAAEEVQSKWQVAIKVVSDRYRKDIAMLTRIQLEAQAGMRLKHPNILRTFSIDRSEDSFGEMYYVVMELVKGISLNELIALEKVIPIAQACDIVRQAALGLQHAHEAGLIHRDVKPDNLLIRSDGSVKILDFGLAMMDENDEEFTMAMILGQDRLGTADYVAPEQSVNSYRVDHRADIYGLGCTLYFALAGRPPFQVSSNADKIRCHREKKPTLIRELRPEVPERIQLLLDMMMAKRPVKRLESASAVAEWLDEFSARQVINFDFARIVKARTRWAKKRELQRRLRDESVTRGQSLIEPRVELPEQPFSATSNGTSSAASPLPDEVEKSEQPPEQRG